MGSSDLLILLGSARPDGNTAEAVRMFRNAFRGQTELIELASCRIRPFTYQRVEGEDDFEGIVERMLAHRQILMATPVYWYAMSGIMKLFFDRLTDLLTSNDPARRGRALAGRKLWLLAVGTDPCLPQGFEVPFASSARYLDMEWGGSCYCPTTGEGLGEDADAAIRAFCETIFDSHEKRAALRTAL